MTGSADDDLLAVEARDEAQRAVGGRVLRADVEGHVVGLELDVDLRVGQAWRGRRHAELRAVVGGGGHALAPSRRSASSSAVGSPGIGSTSTRPGHGFTRGRAAGSPCAAGGPRTRPAGRGGGGRVAVEAMPNISQRLALVPVGAGVDRHQAATCGVVVGHVGLERDARVVGCVDCTWANTWKRVSPTRRSRTVIAVGLHRRATVSLAALRRRARRRRAASRSPAEKREEVAARAALAHRRPRRPRVGPHADDERAARLGVLDDGVAELGSSARAARARERIARAARRARRDRGAVGLAARRPSGRSRPRSRPSARGCTPVVSRRRSAHRASAAPARRCRCPRSGCAPGAARCPRAAPRAAAGSRARRRRPG